MPLIDSAQSIDGQHIGDVELLVVDRKSLQVRQRLLQPGLMDDDAIAIRGIEFDTGRYGLAPGVTAFGLRIEMANHAAQSLQRNRPAALRPEQAMRCDWCSTVLSLPAMAAKATPIARDPFIPARSA